MARAPLLPSCDTPNASRHSHTSAGDGISAGWEPRHQNAHEHPCGSLGPGPCATPRALWREGQRVPWLRWRLARPSAAMQPQPPPGPLPRAPHKGGLALASWWDAELSLGPCLGTPEGGSVFPTAPPSLTLFRRISATNGHFMGSVPIGCLKPADGRGLLSAPSPAFIYISAANGGLGFHLGNTAALVKRPSLDTGCSI